jgi:hypothetical protein
MWTASSDYGVGDGSTNNRIVVTDNGNKGMVYAADYTANFTTHSLVTKQYVDSVVTGAGLTAQNGLTETSPNVIALGGNLTQNTTIDGVGGSYSLTLGNIDNFIVSASSSFDISVDNGLIILDSGVSGSVDIYGGDIFMFATGSIDITSVQDFNIQTQDYNLDFTGFGTVSVGGSTAGLVYSSTPSNALPLTLIHKQYVDDLINVISTTPVYQVGLTTSVSTGQTGILLSATPSDYSRIQVFVNGQLQMLGDGVTTRDCHFGTTTSAVPLASLASGNQLVWNATNAGFSLSTTDRIDIVYES